MKGKFNESKDIFTVTEDVVIKAGTEFARELGSVYIANTDNGKFVIEDKFFEVEVEKPEIKEIDFSDMEYWGKVYSGFTDNRQKVFISSENRDDYIYLNYYEIVFDHEGMYYTKENIEKKFEELFITQFFPKSVIGMTTNFISDLFNFGEQNGNN